LRAIAEKDGRTTIANAAMTKIIRGKRIFSSPGLIEG
jgi:hypothetical protein